MARITKLPAPESPTTVPDPVQQALNERVKELTCLYQLSSLIETIDDSPAPFDTLFGGAIDILPGAMKYSEVASARIVHASKAYVSPGFTESAWKLAADIVIDDAKSGEVEIRYLRPNDAFDEDPFLPEERTLIKAVAERLGRCVERVNAQQLLRAEQVALQHKDIALGQVLEKVRREQEGIGRQVVTNINKIIMPLLADLERGLTGSQRKCAVLLRESLLEITSPFAQDLSNRFDSLTPTEIRVSNLIRRGLSCKEIAAIEHVSPGTIGAHRFAIRRKLGLLNSDVNLQTFLQRAVADEAHPSIKVVLSNA